MYIQDFLSYIQFEKRYSRHTLLAYQNDLNQFSDFILIKFQTQDPNLLSISHKHVRSWIIFLMDSGVSSKSVNRKISTLKSYYKFLIKRNVLIKSPLLKVVTPKIPKRLPVYVDNKTVTQILTYISTTYPKSSNAEAFIYLRDKLIIELFYLTGIRSSELISLKVTSIDFQGKQLKVLGKGNKERLIPISKNLIDSISQYIQIKDNYLGSRDGLLYSISGRKVYQKLIYNIVHQLLKAVSTIERKSPHILRHTFATQLANNGAELNSIKELLGHSSLASTQVYTHNTIEKLKKVYNQAHPKA